MPPTSPLAPRAFLPHPFPFEAITPRGTYSNASSTAMSGLSSGTLIGVIIGIILLVVIIAALIYKCHSNSADAGGTKAKEIAAKEVYGGDAGYGQGQGQRERVRYIRG